MRPFALARAADLDDAASLARDAVPIAGGTDLIGLMKSRVVQPERLVDLTGIGGLSGWSWRPGEGLRIGALTRLAALESSADVRRLLPIVPASLADAATVQLREMGTVGGNLLQRNRCWYFRDDSFKCWLKGGDRCFAREGEHHYHAVVGARECVIASPSDLAPALIACDASLEIRSGERTRQMPLAELFLVPHGRERREHSLAPGELITAVLVPETALARKGAFRKQMDRKAWSFALVSVAASARVEGGRARDVRIVLGGVAPIPWRARDAEAALEGATLDEVSCTRAAGLALAGAEPLRDNSYKVPLGIETVRRALLSLAE